jgi:hypothetical protein
VETENNCTSARQVWLTCAGLRLPLIDEQLEHTRADVAQDFIPPAPTKNVPIRYTGS